jgi:hypothetical protein
MAGIFRAAFPEPDFYLEETAIREAIQSRGMLNVTDARDGDQVDFWLLTDGAFDQARFERLGGSDKQFVDALRVYEVQHGALDETYMDIGLTGSAFVPRSIASGPRRNRSARARGRGGRAAGYLSEVKVKARMM